MSARRARLVVLCLALTLVGFACAACTSGVARPQQPSTSADAQSTAAAAALPVDSASALLSASWASNGTIGFFIEAPDVGQAMSLYSTRWWLEVYTRQHHIIVPTLDRAAVRAWVLPLAAGEPAVGGDAARLPAMARLDEAVRTLSALGGSINSGPTVAALETLRAGGMYRSGPGAAADWGDTFLALSVYRALGVPAPAAVTAATAVQVHHALTDQNPADLLDGTVPALASLTPQAAAQDRPALAIELAWVQAQLPRLPVLGRVAVATALAPVSAQAGAPRWAPATVCAGLRVSPSGVAASASTAPDPQLTANALALGCLTQQSVPPWTLSGWPNTDAVTTSLPASVDGFRVAAGAGLTRRYAGQLRSELMQVWAPAYVAKPTATVAVAADLLARELNVPLVAPESSAGVHLALASTDPRSATTALLQAAVTYPKGIQGDRPANAGLFPVPAGQPAAALTAAVADELRARVTADAALHRSAVAVIATLRLRSTALYTLGSATVPSLLATIFGSWIMGRPLSGAALRSAGICGPGYWSCVDDSGSTRVPALQTAAAVEVLSQPGSDSYPFAF